MLAAWGALTDPATKETDDGLEVETNEAREARMRAAYNSALQSHSSDDLTAARHSYVALAGELKADEEPDWVRSVLYATLRNLGDVLLDLDDPVEALERYGQALEVDGSDFLVWRSASKAALACGRLHVARRAVEHALLLRPDHWLCVEEHKAILGAIGDADEDVLGSDAETELTLLAVASRAEWMGKERVAAEAIKKESMCMDDSGPGCIEAEEPTWACIVNVLRAELKRRLSNMQSSIGMPVHVKLMRPPVDPEISEQNGDDLEIIEPGSPPRDPAPTGEVVIDLDDSGDGLGTGKSDEGGVVEPPEQKMRLDSPKRQLEVRKSKRQAGLDQERERLRSREEAAAAGRHAKADWGLSQKMMRILNDVETGNSVHASVISTSEPIGELAEKDVGKEKVGSWSRSCSQAQEECEVAAFVEGNVNVRNGGPLDVLLQVLQILTAKQVRHHSDQIALCWLNVFRHLPSTFSFSVLERIGMAESLLASGDKASRKVPRLARFREARRLLSSISTCEQGNSRESQPNVENLGLDNVGGDSYVDVRIEWATAQLCQRSGDVQLARNHIERCREALQRIEASAKPDMSDAALPTAAGPVFCGLSICEALERAESESSAFKRAEELADAQAAVSLGKNQKDPTRGKTAIGLLWSSLEAYISRMRFEVTRNFSSDIRAVVGSPDRDAFDKHVSILTDACEICGDEIGDLVCKSVSLRASLIELEILESEKAKTSASGDAGRVRGKDQAEDQSELASPSSKRAELVADLRPYVASIKKVSNVPAASREQALGHTGWSPKQALSLAGRLLVSAADMLQGRIPPVPSSCNSLVLSTSQKNQRLAFARTMLGFGRCVDGIVSTTSNDLSSQCVATSRALTAFAFALRALAPRACLRDEGTAGALLKLYMTSLSSRLRQLARENKAQDCEGVSRDRHSNVDCPNPKGPEAPGEDQSCSGSKSDDAESGRTSEREDDADVDVELAAEDCSDWDDVLTVRFELSQCFRCLFDIPDLESLGSPLHIDRGNDHWMVDGVALSKRVGLSFATGEAAKAAMDAENCRLVFDFHRSYLFEALACQWRDGKKSRRARELITKLAESLPSDAPVGVPLVPASAVDAALTESLTDYPRDAVKALRDEWNASFAEARSARPRSMSKSRAQQFSRMYYELHVMHVVSTMSFYDAEFKKQKVVERRKSPKETVERLINQASQDCVSSLRARPWSTATWTLAGRVLLEIADVALDEREYASSTFGIVRGDDLASGDLGDPVVSILGQAEGCFRFADALTKETWVPEPFGEASRLSDEAIAALDIESYGTGGTDADKCQRTCLGTDVDLFGWLGIPSADDPDAAVKKQAVMLFGEAALVVTKLREERYRSRCWRTASLMPRVLDRKGEYFLAGFDELVASALECLEKGMLLAFPATKKDGTSVSASEEKNGANGSLSPREDDAFSSLLWLYKLQRAKLHRKKARSDPIVYLGMFGDAAAENARYRESLQEPPDIEPIYKLHATRLKVLLEQDVSGNPELLASLERYAFRKEAVGVAAATAAMEAQANDAEAMSDQDKGPKTVGESRRELIARDVCAVMQWCRQQKQKYPHAEFFFKGAYIRALALWRVLGDRQGALAEMRTMFRGEAAARTAEPSSDGVHRGYFFTVWNYRHTDTGHEMALETERKYLRWRNKLLGLYGALLDETQDARMLAGVISRLKRRHPDDLPVNGAILDDLVGSYADVCIARVQRLLASGDEGDMPTIALSEAALHRTWDMYSETIRLSQGVRRTRQYMERDPETSGFLKLVVDSHRPWCLVAAACALHMEWKRLQAAKEGRRMCAADVARLPVNGEDINDIAPEVFAEMAESIASCAERWPVESKMVKPVRRRIEEYRRGGPLHGKSSQASKVRQLGDAGDGCVASAAAAAGAAKLLGAIVSPVKGASAL